MINTRIGAAKEAHMNEQQLKALRKIRGDWGGVKPYTRIERNRKKYDRKQNKKIEREAYRSKE